MSENISYTRLSSGIESTKLWRKIESDLI